MAFQRRVYSGFPTGDTSACCEYSFAVLVPRGIGDRVDGVFVPCYVVKLRGRHVDRIFAVGFYGRSRSLDLEIAALKGKAKTLFLSWTCTSLQQKKSYGRKQWQRCRIARRIRIQSAKALIDRGVVLQE